MIFIIYYLLNFDISEINSIYGITLYTIITLYRTLFPKKFWLMVKALTNENKQ